MTARAQASIRLATSGKGDVKRDFQEIGDAASAQAKRYSNAFERASAEAERAIEKQAKAAARLASVAPTASGATNLTNPTTGRSYATQDGAAERSAKALAAALDQAESEAKQLLASIDPLFAAQTRYANQVDRINTLRGQGVLDEKQHLQLLNAEKAALDDATAAAARNNGVSAQRRAGMQQLGFQLGDISQQYALGTSAAVIFAQQSGQTVQALQMMGGEGNKFLRFLGGPWGIGLSVAAVALTPLIAKLFDARDETTKLVDELVEHEAKTRASAAAQVAFERTADGAAAAIGKLTDELKSQNLTLEDNIKLRKAQIAANIATIAGGIGNEGKGGIGQTSAELATAVAAMNAARQREAEARSRLATSSGRGMEAAAGQLALASSQARAAEDKVKSLTDRLNVLSGSMDGAARALRSVDFPLLEREAREAVDPLARINRQYDDMATKAKAAAVGNDKLKASLGADLRDIERRREADLAAERKKQSGSASSSGGRAIFDDQIASFLDKAASYRGLREGSSALDALFKGGGAGINLDPEKTAWCAAFINAVLASNGVKGTGSLAAASFLNYGKDDMRSPQRGDIVVVKSGASPSGQHVGFLESVDANGNVKVLGGNTGNKVASATYAKDQVLAIRRPPTPSEAARQEEIAAAREQQAADLRLRQAGDFDARLAALNSDLLRSKAEQVRGAERQAEFARQQIEADEKAQLQAIQNDLAEGKFGEATSQLAIERANQLSEVVKATAAQRTANQAMADYLRWNQDRDATDERRTGYLIEEKQHLAAIAGTAKERRQLQLEIVDLEFDQKKRHLEIALQLAKLAGETARAVEIQDELNQLAARRGRAKEQARDQTQSPGEAYLASGPKNMAQLQEGFEQSMVDNLGGLDSKLTDVLTKAKSFKDLWKGLKGVVHDTAQAIIADLLQMAIRMFVVNTIMKALFPSLGSSGSAPSANAQGTEYASGGLSWVGENGPELVRLPRGSKVSPAAESRRMAAAAAGAGGPPVSLTFHNDFRGADSSAVAAIQSRMDQLESTLPGRVVEAYQDARSRFVIR